MQENKLLASVVLFRELYDRDKDIYDVIGALIKAAILFEEKWAFNTTEAAQLLESSFGFQIPEAVVKTVLRNRLKNKENILAFDNGVYSLVSKKLEDATLLSSELAATKNKQEEITNDLVTYISERSIHLINENERAEIVDSFSAYLLDSDTTNKYSGLISSYIIERQATADFTDSLNAVREGFVFYNGVRYCADLNDLGSWKEELTIYLDTEHLFNAAGYNGVLYKQLFDDFYGLIREINQSGKKYITLKYFEENRDDVDSIFHVAELIHEGKLNLNPSKSAMVRILEGSKTKSDILEKKARLYSELTRRRISLETKNNFYDEPDYIVDGQGLIDKLKNQAEDDGWPFDVEKCIPVLKLFTKINVLRQGRSSGALDKIGFILMTGKSYSKYLAFNPLIKAGEDDVPFATDIEYLTNRFWFKLKKGLIHHDSLPRSMDVVAKAQVVLSSQINNSVSDKYDALKEKLANGEVTKEDAEYINHELRNKAASPEDITPDNVEDGLAFLSHENYEIHLREKSLLERKAAEGDAAIKKIKAIEQQGYEKRKYWLLLKAKVLLGLTWSSLIILIVCSYGLALYLLNSLRSETDSTLTLFAIMFSFVVGTIPLIKFKKIKDRIRKYHADMISRI